MNKAITKEEVRELFLDQIRTLVWYWGSVESTEVGKLEGLAFSMLSMIDGCSGGFPATVDLVLRPHPDDKKYSIDNDEDWIEDGMVINDDCHLHEMLFRKEDN